MHTSTPEELLLRNVSVADVIIALACFEAIAMLRVAASLASKSPWNSFLFSADAFGGIDTLGIELTQQTKGFAVDRHLFGRGLKQSENNMPDFKSV